MKQKYSLNESVSKHRFLQKFAGKLNMISKHGQITDEKGFKLPLINSLNQKRASTMLLRTSKKQVYSMSSQGNRGFSKKLEPYNTRAQKYLIHGQDNVLTDMSNSYLKNHKKQLHKKSDSNQVVQQTLTTMATNRHPASQRPQSLVGQHIFPDRARYSQYENFMTELQGIKKKTVRHKKCFI